MDLKEKLRSLNAHQRKLLFEKLGGQANLGPHRLVAFVQANNTDSPPTQRELKEFLSKKLPAYSIPSMIEYVDRFPLTPNGKIDARALTAKCVRASDRESPFKTNVPVTSYENELLKLWREALSNEAITIDDDFFEFGGDSILAIKLISRIRQSGYKISIAELFKNPTVRSLCQSSIETGPVRFSETDEQRLTGQIPFHPIQQWFFNKRLSHWSYWNQSLLIELPFGITYEVTRAAIENVRDRHDALRIRILESPSGWLQIVQGEAFESLELRKSHLPKQAESTELRFARDLANKLHKSIDPRKGVMLGASYIDRGESTPPYLLLACHHLAIDAFSWGVLLNELNQFLSSSNREESDSPPLPVSHSYASCCQHLGSLPFSSECSEDINFWNDQSFGNYSFLEPILGSTENLEIHSRLFKQNLLLSEIGLDIDDSGISHKEIQSRLIACLGMGLKRLTNLDSICIGVEGHGRSITELDLSYTIGWLTSYFPFNLDLSAAHTLPEALIETRIQLQSIPKNGTTFGPLKYSGLLNREASTVEPELVFNYLGGLGLSEHDNLKIVESNPGENRHPNNERICLLEIDAFLADEELHLHWNYPVSRVGEDFVRELGLLVAQFLSQLGSELNESTNQKNLDSHSPDFRLKPDSEKPCLSYAQERICYLELHLGPSPAFNTCSLVFLNERLDLSLLRQSIKAVVQCQDSLRTCIKPSESGHPPYPVVNKIDPIDWPLEIEVDSPRSFRNRINALAKEPMDLEKGPLFQCYHGYGDDSNSVLLFKMHHIITDGWSYEVLYNELFENYLALKRGQTPNSRPPDFQYTDYAYSERLPATEMAIRRDLIFWRSRLARLPPPLSMPFDFPRPPEQSYRGNLTSLHIDKSVVSRIDELARECGSTAFNVILAAYTLMLGRNSGQEDLIIGVPVTNRGDTRFERVVGLFVNMAPLRISLSGNLSVTRYIKELSLRSQEVLSRNAATFERIVREINPERDPSHTPVFQTAFMYDHGRRESLSDPDFRLTAEPVDTGSSNYDLTLAAQRQNGILTLMLEYCTDLFTETTANRFLSQTKRILNVFIESPKISLSSISLLDREEKLRILKEWNETSQSYPKNATIHNLIERQAKLNPKKVAVSFGNSSINYSELEARSNRLARYLSDQGVKPGMLIGVLMERSIEMLISLISILKTGCAYVPIDPNYPLKRVELILKYSAAYAVLTRSESEQVDFQQEGTTTRYINIDSIADLLSQYTSLPLKSATKSSDLAYVIFTSGSTGEPKGVAVEHGSVCNFLLAMQSQPGMDENDSLLAVTTVSFDISCLELFLPLVSGARVVIADSQMATDGQALSTSLANENITIMQATPATWRLMLKGGWEGRTTLKILCGGEAMPKDLAEDLLPKCKELWNMYGPTETTVWSTCERVTQPDRITIGRPIANTQTYIVDQNFTPVPIGVVGELMIAGHGLARGYWDNETLTQKAFIQNPFQPKGRVYRTGDLARWLEDGRIECLGRADNQIKVRGFRIEPGEIEATLADIPGVAQAVVVAQDIASDDRRLVAYLVLEKSAIKLEDFAIRKQLETLIPSYMIPSAFVWLDQLPLTPSGKVDKRSLPQHETFVLNNKLEFKDPQGETETELANIFCDILKISKIGRSDNFFDLGGYSLLAVNLFQEIEKKWCRKLPLATLFRNPTVESLAKILNKDNSISDKWNSLVHIKEGTRKNPLYLVHGAGGNVLLYQKLSYNLKTNLPIYGLQSIGLDGKSTPFNTVEEMAISYVNEVMNRQAKGPYYLTGYCVGGKIAFEMARILMDRGENVAFLAILDSYNFNIPETKNPSISKLSYYLQLSRFHAKNLLSLKLNQMPQYLKEKSRMAKENIIGRLKFITYDSVKSNLSGTTKFIQAINDKAGELYNPKPYYGETILVRPKYHYSNFVDPKMGWGNVAKGNLNVEILEMNPHAMLVEPFVRELAAVIDKNIEPLITSN